MRIKEQEIRLILHEHDDDDNDDDDGFWVPIIETLFSREQKSEDPWLFFEAK